MNATTYAVDIAKNVFQIHWIELDTGEIHSKKLSREKLVDFFARRSQGRVVMEACGGAHYWGRVLQAQGHEVQLLPAGQVRAFVRGNKDDMADARAIYLAAQHADIRRVPLKGEQQQAELSVHRIRSHWVSLRTSTINALRGLLYEFGIVLSKGRKIAMRQLAEQAAQIEARLPPLMSRLVHDQLLALREIDVHVTAMDRELETVQTTNPVAKRLSQVPGIGVISASALASTLGDGRAWRSAREFASCMGLTPSHTGTGGKIRMGKISKRGDAYIRTLLIHGARNLVRFGNPPEWIASMLARRPFNVVATAVAHKLARIAWAMVTHERSYEQRWKNAQAQTS